MEVDVWAYPCAMGQRNRSLVYQKHGADVSSKDLKFREGKTVARVGCHLSVVVWTLLLFRTCTFWTNKVLHFVPQTLHTIIGKVSNIIQEVDISPQFACNSSPYYL